MNDGKRLFKADTKFNKGFKFDHLWAILKNLERFKDNKISEKQNRQRKECGSYYSSDDQNVASPILGCHYFL